MYVCGVGVDDANGLFCTHCKISDAIQDEDHQCIVCASGNLMERKRWMMMVVNVFSMLFAHVYFIMSLL